MHQTYLFIIIATYGRLEGDIEFKNPAADVHYHAAPAAATALYNVQHGVSLAGLTACILTSFDDCISLFLNQQNVTVDNQPTTVTAAASAASIQEVQQRRKQKPTLLIVTSVLTVVCVLQACWPALVCLGPALIAAIVVSYYLLYHVKPRFNQVDKLITVI